jgi:hypothetical protein
LSDLEGALLGKYSIHISGEEDTMAIPPFTRTTAGEKIEKSIRPAALSSAAPADQAA